MCLEAVSSDWGMCQAWAPLLPRSGSGELDIGREEEDPLMRAESVKESAIMDRKKSELLMREARGKYTWEKGDHGEGCHATNTGFTVMQAEGTAKDCAPSELPTQPKSPTLTLGHSERPGPWFPVAGGEGLAISDTGQVLTSEEPEGGRKEWREAFGFLGLSSGSRRPQAVGSNPIIDFFLPVTYAKGHK